MHSAQNDQQLCRFDLVKLTLRCTADLCDLSARMSTKALSHSSHSKSMRFSCFDRMW